MEIAQRIIKKYSSRKNVEVGKMFGSQTLKIRSSVFFILMKDGIVFKLSENGIEEALTIKGADYFDAHKNGKKMKGWIFIPEKSISEKCFELAEEARKNVEQLAIIKIKKASKKKPAKKP